MLVLNKNKEWEDLELHVFPTDYEGSPEQYIRETFPHLTIKQREYAIDKYVMFLLDQPEDTTGE